MIAVRRRRRDYLGKFKLHKSEWIDPFPGVPGTRPEKMIFAALVSRGIFFAFQPNFPQEDRDLSVLLQDVSFKPDFIVPEYRVIYDPFSEFHHSLPGARERDQLKYVYYTNAGYEFVYSWSQDIERFGGQWAVDQSTRINGKKTHQIPKQWLHAVPQGYFLGENLGLGATSVGAANRKRKKPKGVVLRSSR
jgi:hypothetical protein